MKRPAEESVGERFGRLVVLSIKPSEHGSGAIATAKCDCGKEVVVPLSKLRSGTTQSCGCLHADVSADAIPPKLRARVVVIDGVERDCASVAAEHGIKGSTLRMRIRAGWDLLKACTTPPEETAHETNPNSERQRAIARGGRATITVHLDAQLLALLDAALDGKSRSAWIENLVKEKLSKGI